MALPPPIHEPEFDSSRFDLRHVIDIGLQAKRELKPPRTNTGWTSGALGYCLRRQFLERAGVEVAESYPLRTFWIGDLIHNGYQRQLAYSGLLIHEELHLVDEELDLSGYVDMVWGGIIPNFLTDDEKEYKPAFQEWLKVYRDTLARVYGDVFPVTGDEMKSANDYSARKMQQEGPQFHHLMQVASYALMEERNQISDASIERWRLSIIDKSDGLMNVFEVRDSHVARAEERIRSLNDYWKARDLPPCTCGKDIPWEVRYCKYATADGCCDAGLIETATSEEFWDGIPDVVVEPDAPEMGQMQED